MTYQAQEETISFLLNQICRAQRGHVADSLARIGLYAGQEACLWQLWREDGLTQTQMVERMCVQPPTVSKMIDRLEKTGLVSRRPDPDDSRATRVFLTEQGRAIEHGVCDAWCGLEERMVAHLSADEQAVLRRLLLQVFAGLTPGEVSSEQPE